VPRESIAFKRAVNLGINITGELYIHYIYSRKKHELGLVKSRIYTSCFRKMDGVILSQLFGEVIDIPLRYTICFEPSNLPKFAYFLSASEITTTFALILDVFMKKRMMPILLPVADMKGEAM